MKKNVIPFMIALFVTSFGFSQQNNLVNDQNPNYKLSMNKYMKVADKYSLEQSTTAQETYKAIDPLERKRELRALKRKYRANRLLWRHQERMERAKYGNYYQYDGYNGYNYSRGYNNNWFGNQSLLNLGLLGSYFIFD